MGKTKPTKWTEEKTIELLSEALHNLQKDKKMLLKEEVFLSVKELSGMDWSQLRKDFKNIKEIQQLYDEIEKILKFRVIKPAIKGQHSASFTQFYLKNAYRDDYKDKQEIEHSGDTSMLELIKSLNKGS